MMESKIPKVVITEIKEAKSNIPLMKFSTPSRALVRGTTFLKKTNSASAPTLSAPLTNMKGGMALMPKRYKNTPTNPMVITGSPV